MTAVFRLLGLLGAAAATRRLLDLRDSIKAFLLRWTGLGLAIHLLGYVALRLPKTTTAAGVVLLLGGVAIHLELIVDDFALPDYLSAYFALLVALALVAALALLAGRFRAVTRAGWALGSVISLASIAMYLTSHTAGLPGLPLLIGRWDYPLGTFAMILAASFVAVHFSVIAKVSVAYPDTRDWAEESGRRGAASGAVGQRERRFEAQQGGSS